MTTGEGQARACVFCGGTPVTDEHVWPQWLATVLPDEPLRHFHEMAVVGEEPTIRSWRGPPFNQKVKRVCAQCNNGWMSRLESDAKSILSGMIRGRGRALHANGQRTVAAWIFKTVLMFEYVHPDTATIPDAHRNHLYEHGEPSPETHIWVMGYDGPMRATYRQFDMGYTPTGGDAELDAYAATLSISAFVGQVAGLEGHDVIRTGGLQPSLRKIWPEHDESFTWPPQPVLDTAELIAIHDSFKNR